MPACIAIVFFLRLASLGVLNAHLATSTPYQYYRNTDVVDECQ